VITFSTRFLEDDAPFGDLTTYVLGFGAERGRIAFSARDRMVLACAEEAARLFERAGAHATALSASDAVDGSSTVA
jgi:molybdenum transport protein